MTPKVAFGSLLAFLSSAFASKHAWRNDDSIGVRTCTVCGRNEELDVDLVNTSWEVVELGDAGAHAVKARREPAAASAEAGLALAREDQLPVHQRT